jgi:dsRNA-specific ribonuclease
LDEPSVVEARIGRIYTAEGLEAAFQWTESELMPTFEKQGANRKKNAHRR